MKRVYIFLLLLPNILQAQKQGTFDFNVGAGILSTNHIINILVDIVTFDDSRTTFRTPAINTTLKYAIKDNWFVNADGSYELEKEDLYKNEAIVGHRKNSYYSIGIGTEYHYLNKEFIQVYSGGAIGGTFKTSNTNGTIENDHGFNFQLNLIGVRIGKKVAGTLELGVGYKGIINAGLSYQY